MIPDTKWEPTASDIDWQRGMVRILHKRGTWAVPGALSVFKIDKDKMKFMLSTGDPDDEVNRRIAKVFRILGFSEGELPEEEAESTDRFPPSMN